MRRVAITGLGLSLPGAQSLDELAEPVRLGHTFLGETDRITAAPTACADAGVVEDGPVGAADRRLRKRMDRFTWLAMAAARRALEDAASPAGPDRTGVYLANMFGGWEITDPSLRGLFQTGYTGVSPYIASAWFPTAAQGQITINRGLKGFSKTIAADTAGAALALGYAARAVQEGRADLMLCGGAEAPVTPYAYTFCLTSGRLAAGTYHPFHQGADGFCVGEGAVVLALEDHEAAVARGARIHAELAGFAAGHAPADDVFGGKGRRVLAEVVGEALDEAGVAPGDLDYVGLDAQGASAADRSELVALTEVLGAAAADVPCTSVKPVTGHLLGAAPAVEVAGALLAMRTGVIPPIAGCEHPLPALDLVTGRARTGRRVRTALVNARGADGTVAALVLKAH